MVDEDTDGEKFDEGIVGVKLAEIDVGEVDGVVDQEEEAAAAVARPVTPDNGVAIEFWVARRRKQLSLLDGGDNDVVFFDEIAKFGE